MQSVGIVRKLDRLGRIVIPKELCRTFEIEEQAELEIFTEGDRIILQKYEPACIFCGTKKDTIIFKGKKICKECAARLSLESTVKEVS